MAESGQQPAVRIQEGEYLSETGPVPAMDEQVLRADEEIPLADDQASHIPAGVGVRIKSLKKETLPEINADTAAVEVSEAAHVETPAVIRASGNKGIKSKRGRKSLKQGTADADLIDIPDDETLFSKQYYTMGETAEMFRVNQSLLRFWETEFNILQPRKNKKGDRYFRPIDIKNLHLIYHLLRQRKYTIEGAKEFLKKNKKAEERFEAIRHLQQVRAFLLEWKAQL